MPEDQQFDLGLFMLGGSIVPIWIGCAIVAFRYKRAFVSAGFMLAGLNSIPSAFIAAHAHVPDTVQLVSSALKPFVVCLIVGGYLGARPSRPPAKWTP